MRNLLTGLRAALVLSATLALSGCPWDGGDDAPPAVAPDVPPTISSQPQPIAVAEGQAATFTVVASGTAPLSYQWRRSGAAIAGATGASYTLVVATPADDGAQFSVVVTNAAGSIASAPATLSVTPAPAGLVGVRIAAGGRAGLGFSAARAASGTMWAWGANGRGAVGDGTRVDRQLPFAWSVGGAVTAISLGNEATMVADAAGAAFWAGASSNGQNGTPVISDLLTPTRVTVQSSIVAIAVGNGYTVATLADGTVRGWGSLPTGVRTTTPVQIDGFANIASVCVAEESILGLKNDGTVWFAGTDRAGAMPGQGRSITATIATATQVPGLSQITHIACGLGTPTAFALALRSDGTVHSWGDAGGLGYAIPVGQFVQLSPQQVPGLGAIARVAASNTGLPAAFAVTSDGRVHSWGYDNSGALALGAISSTIPVVTPTLSTAIDSVVEVATSGLHTLFVKRDGSVWGVGSNANGQLGNTSPAALGNSLVPVQVQGLNLN